MSVAEMEHLAGWPFMALPPAGVRGVLCWRHPPLTCTPLPQRFTNERKDKIKHQKTNFQKKSIITNTIKDKGDSNNTAAAPNQVLYRN